MNDRQMVRGGLVRRVVAIGAVLLVSALGVSGGTYYVDWVGGSDANNGTSTGTAWKRAPGMNGFAGAYAHVAGDRFLFKGGVTWPNSAFQWRITQGGSGEAARDYYGVDTSWFTGAAWTRPVMDGQATRVNNGTVFAAMVHLSGGSYITIDRLEFTGLAATKTDYGAMCLSVYGPVSNLLVTGCVGRDWQIVKNSGVPYAAGDGGGWDSNGVGFFGTFGGGHGWVGSIIVSNCVAHQSGVAQKSGASYRSAPDVRDSEAYNTTQGVLGGAWVDGCTFHDFPSPTDPVSHCNGIEIFGPNVIKNNVLYNLSNETSPILSTPDFSFPGQANLTSYVYNNVLWNTGSQTPIGLDVNSSASGLYYYVWNNTVLCPHTWPVRGQRGTLTIDYVEMRNNHFITDQDPPYYFPYGETIVYEQNLKQTPGQASTTGYTIGNRLQPSGASSPTVGIGTNLSAHFTVDVLGVTRTVPWDVGAYEWEGTVTPQNPPGTPVNVTPVNGATGQSLTVTLVTSGYSDPGGKAHVGSQFRVYESDGVTLVWDSGTLGPVTSKVVEVGELAYEEVYKWGARYQNALGLWGGWSALTSFTTLDASPPATPTNVAPANGATDVARVVTLVGSAYSDPNGSAQSGSQWLLLAGTNVVDSGGYTAVTSYPVPVVLSNATLHTWMVRYRNGYDLWSDYSAATSFTTTNEVSNPVPPPPLPPPPPPSTNPPVLPPPVVPPPGPSTNLPPPVVIPLTNLIIFRGTVILQGTVEFK